MCSVSMTSLMRTMRSERILDAPGPARACMAAKAYLRCVQREGEESSSRAPGGPPPLWTPRSARLAVQPLAERLHKTLCADIQLSVDDAAALDRLLEKYTWGPRDLTME